MSILQTCFRIGSVVLIAVNPITADSSMGSCSCIKQQRVIQKQVVQKVVRVKEIPVYQQVVPQVYYFVNPPQAAPVYGYSAVQEATYEQLANEVENLANQLRQMREYQPPQYTVPQYSMPQYTPPQYQQPQYSAPPPPVQQQQQCPQCGQPNSIQPGVPFSQQAPSMIQQNCVKCHSGDEPKAGLSLDSELDWETKLKVAKQVGEGNMPLKSNGDRSPLTNEQKEKLYEELMLD